MKLGKYIYGFVEFRDNRNFLVEGILPEYGEVETVVHRDLAVLVSAAPFKGYEPVKELVLQHEKVIATVMKECSIIPARFGMVVRDEGQIAELLELNYDVLKGKLQELKDKVELSLRVFWQKDKFVMDVENEKIKQLKEEILAEGNNNHFKQVELGELVFQVTEKKRDDYIKAIYEPLKSKAAAAKLNSILNVRMVFNSVFLVNKDQEEEFDQLVNEAYLKYQEILDFKYSGPWPPYNFVELDLRFGT